MSTARKLSPGLVRESAVQPVKTEAPEDLVQLRLIPDFSHLSSETLKGIIKTVCEVRSKMGLITNAKEQEVLEPFLALNDDPFLVPRDMVGKLIYETQKLLRYDHRNVKLELDGDKILIGMDDQDYNEHYLNK